jgi:hypothetical protein
MTKNMSHKAAYLETATRLEAASHLFKQCGFDYCDMHGRDVWTI